MQSKRNRALEASNDAEALDDLRREYKKIRRGYRASLYGIMRDVMFMVTELRVDRKRRLALKDKINFKKKSDLTLATLRYITGTTGKKRSKTADKRARVMNFLYDELHIEPPDFPTEIKRRGGIEKIAREAAKSSASPIEPTPDNDNSPVLLKMQIKPRLRAKIAGIQEGAEFKLIATKKSGQLIVKKVLDQLNRSAA